MLELNKIHLGDCLELLKSVPNESINLVMIDPPYNIKKADWDSWATVKDYVRWMGLVFQELERVLKPNGSFYFWHNDFMQIVELQNELNQNTQFIFKQLITWNKIDPSFKNYGFVQQRLSVDSMQNYYNGFTEYCLFYTKLDYDRIHDNSPYFKNIKKYLIEEKQKTGLKTKDLNRIIGTAGMAGHYFGQSQWQLPSKEKYELLQTTGHFKKPYEDLLNEYEEEIKHLMPVFNVQQVKQNLRANSNVWLNPPAKNLGHITPKPVELIENILLHSSNPNDIVLDCFGGSGTTAVACINTNRHYILMEQNKDYYDLTNRRITEAKSKVI